MFYSPNTDNRNISDEIYTRAIKALVRKLDIRLIPFLTFLEVLSFLCRVNIGNAMIAGMNESIHLSQIEYNLAVSLYFVGYIVFEIPSTYALRVFGPSKFLSIITLLWGIITIAMGFVGNSTGLIITRCLLGTTQAGFFPGIIYYFSLWYIREQELFRISIFYCGVLLSGALGGILAYGISHISYPNVIQGWRLIFIVEGAPNIIFGILIYFLLADLPESVQWLTTSEKEMLTNHLRQDTRSLCNGEYKFSWQQVRSTFTDWKVYIYMVIYVINSIVVHFFIIYFPTLNNKEMNFPKAQAQLMSAPPNLISCLITLLISFSATRTKERSYHVCLASLVSIIGFIVIITFKIKNIIILYIITCITSSGSYSTIPLIISWFTSNIGGLTKRAVATGFIIGFGNISGIIVGQIYRKDDDSSLNRIHILCLSFSCLIVFISLILKLILIKENRRREKLTTEELEQELEALGINPCDSHPTFRYIT